MKTKFSSKHHMRVTQDRVGVCRWSFICSCPTHQPRDIRRYSRFLDHGTAQLVLPAFRRFMSLEFCTQCVSASASSLHIPPGYCSLRRSWNVDFIDLRELLAQFDERTHGKVSISDSFKFPRLHVSIALAGATLFFDLSLSTGEEFSLRASTVLIGLRTPTRATCGRFDRRYATHVFPSNSSRARRLVRLLLAMHDA